MIKLQSCREVFMQFAFAYQFVSSSSVVLCRRMSLLGIKRVYSPALL